MPIEILPSKLENTNFRQKLAESLLIDIDDACLELYKDGHRNHLGMSQIGDPCARKLYYNFRWVKEEKHEGRILRLFNRGHLEEKRFVEWLNAIGCQVEEVDAETQKQFRVSDCNGHFGGMLDGKVRLPEKYKVEEWLLLEFKTWKQDAKWNKLLQNGAYKTKGEHYAQMCAYGYKAGLKHGLYLAINKNDDRIYSEIIPLNWHIGEDCVRKAESIITATFDAPPAKVSLERNYFACKWCCYQTVCHDGDDIDKNCRSCRYASAVDDAEWFCAIHNNTIPKDFIPKGCNQYDPIQ